MRFAATLLVASAVWGSSAHAQWEPSGSVSAQVLFEVGTEETRRGGGILVDVWEPFGLFQLGLAVGISAISSDNDDTSQILTPLGLTLGIGTRGKTVGFRVAVRGGMWGGATKSGLEAGGWLSAGAGLDLALDDTVSLGVALDYWRLWGNVDRDVIVPALQLVWRLE